MTEPIKQPSTDAELKEAMTNTLRQVRHERDQWDGALATFRAYIDGPMGSAARQLLEDLARREPLELQWRLEELLEDTAPPEPKKPEPTPEELEAAAAAAAEEAAAEEAAAGEAEEPEDAGDPGVVAPLRPEDLVQIYDDPRGLMIHRHVVDGRWFLTQVNPMTGQPQTMELSAQQRSQVQQELAGSPHWLEKEWDVNPGPSSPIL